MKIYYELYTQAGYVLGVVSVTGVDEEDCQRKIDEYLSTKQDGYCQEFEEDRNQE